jgi:hypothetical protein
VVPRPREHQWYTAPDGIHRDLDTFLAFYNFQRTGESYRVGGRTPAKALSDLISEEWFLSAVSQAAQEVPLASCPTVTPRTGVGKILGLYRSTDAGAVNDSRFRSNGTRIR